MKKILYLPALLFSGISLAQSGSSPGISIDDNGLGKQFPDCLLSGSICKLFPTNQDPKSSNANALESHARDELGINEITQARPMQAALASALAFICGGILPLLVAIFAPLKYMVFFQYGFAIIFLALSGTLAAKAGGSNKIKSVARICIWGTVAMVASALVGYAFGVQTS